MPRNIEVKVCDVDFDKCLDMLQRLENIREHFSITQEDTYFNARNGRFKLRKMQDENKSQLIFYDRPYTPEPSLCDYKIIDTGDLTAADGIKQLIGNAYGIRGIISKFRHVFIVGQTRIHLDRVKDMGDFLELEVVLEENQSEDDGKKIAKEFMELLGVDNEKLVDGSYVDLLLNIKKERKM